MYLIGLSNLDRCTDLSLLDVDHQLQETTKRMGGTQLEGIKLQNKVRGMDGLTHFGVVLVTLTDPALAINKRHGSYYSIPVSYIGARRTLHSPCRPAAQGGRWQVPGASCHAELLMPEVRSLRYLILGKSSTIVNGEGAFKAKKGTFGWWMVRESTSRYLGKARYLSRKRGRLQCTYERILLSTKAGQENEIVSKTAQHQRSLRYLTRLS